MTLFWEKVDQQGFYSTRDPQLSTELRINILQFYTYKMYVTLM